MHGPKLLIESEFGRLDLERAGTALKKIERNRKIANKKYLCNNKVMVFHLFEPLRS
jgi:hypothetical protein